MFYSYNENRYLIVIVKCNLIISNGNLTIKPEGFNVSCLKNVAIIPPIKHGWLEETLLSSVIFRLKHPFLEVFQSPRLMTRGYLEIMMGLCMEDKPDLNS